MAFTDYDKCSLLLPMDGANNGTTFTDWSPNPKTITRNGDAKTVTSQSKYYGSSGYFDGNGDYLSVDNSTAVSSTSFTIALWVYIVSLSSQVTYYDQRAINSDAGFVFYSRADGSLAVYGNGASRLDAGVGKTTTSVWTHIAYTMDGTTQRLFVNGIVSASNTAIWTPAANGCLIGKAVDSTTNNHNGYIQDFLIIKGAALWTSDFTPPARLIGEISGNVKDANDANAQRTIVAFPRTYPQKIFTTTSDGSTGNYTLRVPAIEVSRIALANESTLYNDKVDRIIPE